MCEECHLQCSYKITEVLHYFTTYTHKYTEINLVYQLFDFLHLIMSNDCAITQKCISYRYTAENKASP